MKFLLDENVKKRIGNFLLEEGHDIKYPKKGLDDFEVAKIAKEEGRVLLTHDSDFSNTHLFPPSEYKGIILFRVYPPTFDALKDALLRLLKMLKPEDFSGKLIILEEKRFWIEE